MTNDNEANLFDSVNAPLAARMRPTKLEHYIGQSHILAPSKPLYKAITAGRVHSLILWGAPGTGKTTLAELIARYVDAHVERLSAVNAGVKDIRAAIDAAKQTAMQSGRKTVLFVDEVTVLISHSKTRFCLLLKMVPLFLLEPPRKTLDLN